MKHYGKSASSSYGGPSMVQNSGRHLNTLSGFTASFQRVISTACKMFPTTRRAYQLATENMRCLCDAIDI